MADATNIQLGACSVSFKGTDLGHTIGGVTVTYAPEYHQTKVDKYTAPVKSFLVGEMLTVEVNLAEHTLANLKVAINDQTAVSDDALSIGKVVGAVSSLTGGELKLHPLANASTNYNDDITLYKAVVSGELKIELKTDGEKVLPVKWTAHVDEGRSDGNLLGYIGDSIS